MQGAGLVNPSDVPISRSRTPEKYQVLEAVLHASILDENVNTLYDRLRGVCDPVVQPFEEHEMVFALSELLISFF